MLPVSINGMVSSNISTYAIISIARLDKTPIWSYN